MAVYGEDHWEVDLSKGLFLSPSPDAIPEGFSQKIENLIKNDRSHWETRKGFSFTQHILNSSVDNTSGANNPVTNPIPELQKDLVLRYHMVYGGTSVPQLFISYRDNGGSNCFILHQTGRKAIADTVEFQTQSFGTTIVADAAQYLDRVYGCAINTGPVVDVFQISNWKYDGTTPALTKTNKQTGFAYPAFNTTCQPVLVSYANRLFLGVANRVYYTDVPTPGGYPETWNTSTNFFDLPADNTGTPVIFNMIQLNGLLYFFTDKGIFVLNARGVTSNWTVNFITESIKVVSKHSVALVSGLFIATDRKNLFSFSGSKVSILGQQVRYLFDIYNSFSIIPFEKGFMLACRYFQASSNNWVYANPPGGLAASWPQNKTFYFDGSVWSEFITNSAGNSIDVITGNTGKGKSAKDTENISYVGYFDPTNVRYGWMYYDRAAFVDAVGGSNTAINVKLETRDIIPGIESMWVTNKQGTVKVHSLITPVTINTYKNGTTTVISTVSEALTNQGDNNYRVKFTGVEMATRMSVEVSATAGSPATIFNTDLPDSVPCFSIKSIILVGNTNVREETERESQ